MKVRALKKFEGIRDIERDVFPKEGETWETSEERANFLLSHGVIEIVKEVPVIENVEEAIEKIKKSAKEEVKLNELGNPLETREFKLNKKKKHNKKEAK